jgi:hypothetical protein
MSKKKSNSLDQLREITMAASIVAIGTALLLFMLVVFQNGGMLKTSIIQEEPLQTTVVQEDNRVPFPDPSATSGTNGTGTSPDQTTTNETSQPIESPDITPSASEPPSIQAPLTAPDVSVTSMPQTVPRTGLPENILLGFAMLLGIIGSATFIILKRGV